MVIGLLFFAFGSFWGLAAIALPIVGSLSAALGTSSLLCGGALISASTQITNAEYFRTSGLLVALPFATATVGFIVLGFVMA